MVKSYLPGEKRPDKVPPYLREDLTFDLINAFGLVKGATESALLLKDLLTKKELDNLAKRLRIAKELLSGKKQEEIIDKLHCGFGTVARVQSWLRDGGEGLRRIIVRLPKRKEYPEKKQHLLPNRYRTPQLILEGIQYLIAKGEEKSIKNFLDAVAGKAVMDKSLLEAIGEYYRNRVAAKGTKYNL